MKSGEERRINLAFSITMNFFLCFFMKSRVERRIKIDFLTAEKYFYCQKCFSQKWPQINRTSSLSAFKGHFSIFSLFIVKIPTICEIVFAHRKFHFVLKSLTLAFEIDQILIHSSSPIYGSAEGFFGYGSCIFYHIYLFPLFFMKIGVERRRYHVFPSYLSFFFVFLWKIEWKEEEIL